MQVEVEVDAYAFIQKGIRHVVFLAINNECWSLVQKVEFTSSNVLEHIFSFSDNNVVISCCCCLIQALHFTVQWVCSEFRGYFGLKALGWQWRSGSEVGNRKLYCGLQFWKRSAFKKKILWSNVLTHFESKFLYHVGSQDKELHNCVRTCIVSSAQITKYSDFIQSVRLGVAPQSCPLCLLYVYLKPHSQLCASFRYSSGTY